ncbi:MAG TPA: SpoIIE family protein phosphatase [Stellaceae bacterium]|nr:SpoIIE family protein phosphatase [Stellaceae bacterium]
MARPPADTVDALSFVPLIREHPIFAGLPEAALRDLVGAGSLVTVEADQALVRQGEESDAVFLLLTGEAQIFVETSYGPVDLAPLASGGLFGEIGAFAGLPRTATVRAKSPVRALRIERDYVLGLGRQYPDLLLSVIGQLGQRTGTINRAIGFYTQALAALERHDFDPSILDALLRPVPELLNFAQTFRRMAEQIILRRAQHEEMANAAAIQRAMLPSALPPESCGGRVAIHAEMRPAREVGGDLYDYFLIDPDRLAVVIGDVSGKGVPAALFMAITRTVMRVVLREGGDLATAVGRANEILSAENSESMFATLFCGVLDLAGGAFTYCNCGHNPPYLLRADGAREPLLLTGLPLAAMPGVTYKTRALALRPGERIVLFTDGITEAANAAGEQYDEPRLEAAIEALRQASAGEMVRDIIGRVDEFVAGAPQFDDMTCLVLDYRPAAGTGNRAQDS